MKNIILSLNKILKKCCASIKFINEDTQEKSLKIKNKKTSFFCILLITLNLLDIIIFKQNNISRFVSYYLIVCPLIYILFILKNKNCKELKHISLFFNVTLFICYSPFILINYSFINIIYKILSFVLLIAVGPIFNLCKILLVLLISLFFNVMYMFFTKDFIIVNYLIMFYMFLLIYSQILNIIYKLYIRSLNLLKKDNAKLLNQIETDNLTGLLNRYGLHNRLESLIKLKDFNSKSSVVLMIDIDFFKNYNDAFGHLKGDECLKLIANQLKSSIKKKTDFISRFGGEEFLLYLFDVSDKQSVEIAERICKNIKSLKIPAANTSISSYVTISIGISIYEPKTGFDFFNLLKEADKQLYLIKKDRNGIAFNNKLYYINSGK